MYVIIFLGKEFHFSEDEQIYGGFHDERFSKRQHPKEKSLRLHVIISLRILREAVGERKLCAQRKAARERKIHIANIKPALLLQARLAICSRSKENKENVEQESWIALIKRIKSAAAQTLKDLQVYLLKAFVQFQIFFKYKKGVESKMNLLGFVYFLNLKN